MVNLGLLYCGHGKPQVLENQNEAGHGSDHGYQTKILWSQDTGQNHRRAQLQKELSALADKDNGTSPNSPTFHIIQ